MRELEMLYPVASAISPRAGHAVADQYPTALAVGEVRRKRTKMISLDFRPVAGSRRFCGN